MIDKTFTEILESAGSILNENDKKYLSSSYDTQQILQSAFEKLKKKVPQLLVKQENSIPFIIPAQPESKVDTANIKSSALRVTRDFLGSMSDDSWKAETLYEKYPATEEATLVPYVLPKEMDWYPFTQSLGDLQKIIDHCITPKQFEVVFNEICTREKDKQLEYIVFMEGFHHKPTSEKRDNWRAVHVLRIFAGGMKKEDFERPDRRNVDWSFLGNIYPVDMLEDKLPPMRAAACWHERSFSDSIVLLKG